MPKSPKIRQKTCLFNCNEVQIYDSGGQSLITRIKSTFEKFSRYILFTLSITLYIDIEIGIESENWMKSNLKFIVKPSVLQPDSSSCGVYLILDSLKVSNMISFDILSNNHFVESMRTCLAAEIASKKLILSEFT